MYITTQGSSQSLATLGFDKNAFSVQAIPSRCCKDSGQLIGMSLLPI